jgi:hypothetical protein
MVKKLVLILVAILLMVVILPAVPAFAASSGSVNGSFVVGTPPVVDSVILTPTALSPMNSSPYDVTVNVTAPDTLASLNTVVFKVWHNAGTTPTKTEFDGLTTATADTLTIITWTQSTGSIVMSPVAGSTWVLGTCVVPTTFTGTSFAFHFLFTPGKIAMATTTDKWQVGAEANGSGTGFNFDPEGATMNFYGEITVPSTTVSWGTLTAGTDFTAGIAQKPLGVTINYIANGNYNKQVASSSTWTQTTPPATATLDPGGTVATANQFALKANTSATLGTATLVGATGTNIDITGTRMTTEAGNNVTTMTLWIKLASSFSAASYNGTITYSIVNR